MKKSARKNLIAATSVAALIAAAIVCRYLAHSENFPTALIKALDIVRTFIYLGLFGGWGVTVYRRVMQTQARKLLVITAALMILWLMLRAYKYYFVAGETAIRFLWYAYYIPTVLIPTFSLLVATSLGEKDGYKLPKLAFAAFIPAAILIILALTNDLHQTVFRFAEKPWTEKNYSYGATYYIIAAWCVSCGIGSLALMFIKNKHPLVRKLLWIPIIPFFVAVLYVATYALRVPFVRETVWDVAVFECLIFATFLESCIRCGLIQSNARYEDVFRAAADVSARITDENYSVRYSAKDAEPIDEKTMRLAEKSPVITNGKRVHNMPVRGGHAVWTEDISELLTLAESLKITKEELTDRKGFLEYNYKIEEENKKIEEQNRLYDLLQSKTQRQIDGVERLVKQYERAKDSEKRAILYEIVFLGTFIKRRKDFALTADDAFVTTEKLENALAESFRALSACGVKGAFLVSAPKMNKDAQTDFYDFFEDVAESVTGRARYLTVRIGSSGDSVRMTVTTDGESKRDPSENFPDAVKEFYDGEYSFSLLKKGETV